MAQFTAGALIAEVNGLPRTEKRTLSNTNATRQKSESLVGKRTHPDIAILDVSMPVLNGLDAAERLHSIMPNLPIILFTSYAEALKPRINQGGIVAIFDKGSRLCDLISAIDDCLWNKKKLG